MFRYANEVNEYLRKIKEGDQSQCESLYNITALHLQGIARLYLANKSFAADVVSDAFVKIYKYIASYDCSQDGYNWMCKITQNIAYNYNVKENKIARLERQFVKERLAAGDSNFNEAEFFMQIDVLNDYDKELAAARFYLGMTFDEISESFNMSKSTVYLHFRRICKFLRKKYKS